MIFFKRLNRVRSPYKLLLFVCFVVFMIYALGPSIHYSKTKSPTPLSVLSSPTIGQSEEAEQTNVQVRLSPKEKGCLLPRLNLSHPEIMKFYKKYDPVSCDAFDWVDTTTGHLMIKEEAVDRFGPVSCSLTKLNRISDTKTSEDDKTTIVQNGTELNDDFLKIECNGKDDSIYRNYYAPIIKKKVVEQRRQQYEDGKYEGLAGTALDLDVIVIGQDSLSSLAWLRHLPLTRDYMVNTLGGIEMEGHTIVGDGTPATMFPVLTGKREEELPEARRGYRGANYIDEFPWVWKQFAKSGYVTAWLEDDPAVGTFTYRLMGFNNVPVDHYFRPFPVYVDEHRAEFEQNCIGGRPTVDVQYGYMRDLFRVYNTTKQRKFSFLFRSANTHDNNNEGSLIDLHLRNHLTSLKESGALDNALLVLFADHGARFSNIRKFAQGKLEERMPYFAIRLPDKFKKRHPDIVKNLISNSKKLTTPFDVHETLLELLNFTGTQDANISRRAVSLFKNIPSSRNCASADVDPHWCFCLDWFVVDPKSDTIRIVARHVIDAINKKTSVVRHLCLELHLQEVQSAKVMKVKDDVLRFKDTNDGGRGRFGKMNDDTKHSKIMYQVTFVTSPANGLFEATVESEVHEDGENYFNVDLKSISRINKYGSTPLCIMDRIPELRPYCVCKEYLSVNKP